MWEVRLNEDARKDFARLDRTVQKRIMRYLDERVASLPRQFGAALKGDKKGLWRYRVGDYRIIAQIQEEILLVLVVRIDHRKQVYD